MGSCFLLTNQATRVNVPIWLATVAACGQWLRLRLMVD
jgi:hypothetical protein